MKKSFFLILACFSACLAIAQTQTQTQTPFVIEGRLTGLPDSTKLLLLASQPGGAFQPVDEAYLISGDFTFTYLTEGKTELLLLIDQVRSTLTVWAEPGVMVKVTGEGRFLSAWQVESPIPEQQERDRYRLAAKEERVESQKISEESLLLRRKLAEVQSEEEKQLIREQGKALSRKSDTLWLAVFEKELEVMKNSEPTDYFMDKLSRSARTVLHEKEFARFRDAIVFLYDRLSEEKKLSEEGVQTYRALYPPKKINVGDPVADAELFDLEGNSRKLSEYTGKGKYVLLEFWNSGCGVCLIIMPKVKEIAEQYRGQLEVIGINLDGQKVWEETTKTHGISWVNLNAPGGFGSEMALQYGVDGVPYFFFISPEGILIDSLFGRNGMEDKVKEVLSRAEE